MVDVAFSKSPCCPGLQYDLELEKEGPKKILIGKYRTSAKFLSQRPFQTSWLTI